MPHTVVYVEDNPDNFRLVRLVLESTGDFEVLWAQDGLAGLELVKARRPALVLLDLDLPKIDGFELARRLRADPELDGTPLVAVSANVMGSERDRSIDAGCMAFISKPFDILSFRRKVVECLRRARG